MSSPLQVFSAKEREEIINKYLQTVMGKITLARAMMQPLRTRRDYRTINGQSVPNDAGFVCYHCGYWHDDESVFYDHMREPECRVSHILNS